MSGHVSLSSIMHLKNKMLVHKRTSDDETVRKINATATANAGMSMEIEENVQNTIANGDGNANGNNSMKMPTELVVMNEDGSMPIRSGNGSEKNMNTNSSGKNSKSNSPRKSSKKPRSRTTDTAPELNPVNDHTGLTAEEEAHLHEHAPMLMESTQKKVLTKEEMEERGGIQGNSNGIGGDGNGEDVTWVQIGDSYHMMKVPKRARAIVDDKPLLGVMYRTDHEVVHYK